VPPFRELGQSDQMVAGSPPPELVPEGEELAEEGGTAEQFEDLKPRPGDGV
jgi:hypothetical protein